MDVVNVEFRDFPDWCDWVDLVEFQLGDETKFHIWGFVLSRETTLPVNQSIYIPILACVHELWQQQKEWSHEYEQAQWASFAHTWRLGQVSNRWLKIRPLRYSVFSDVYKWHVSGFSRRTRRLLVLEKLQLSNQQLSNPWLFCLMIQTINGPSFEL